MRKESVCLLKRGVVLLCLFLVHSGLPISLLVGEL